MRNCSECRARDREIERLSEMVGELTVINDLLSQQVAISANALSQAHSIGNDLAAIVAHQREQQGSSPLS